MQNEWYTELYGATDIRALWSKLLPDFKSVRALILETRGAGKGQIVRVIAPQKVSPDDLDALRELGVLPT